VPELAAANANWNAGGSILTFYFPVGLFIIIAIILYLQFWRPHKTPGHRVMAVSAAAPPAQPVPEAAETAGEDDAAGDTE
jgi:hypothetical protein